MKKHKCLSWREIFNNLLLLPEEMIRKIKSCIECQKIYQATRNSYIENLAATGASGPIPKKLEKL